MCEEYANRYQSWIFVWGSVFRGLASTSLQPHLTATFWHLEPVSYVDTWCLLGPRRRILPSGEGHCLGCAQWGLSTIHGTASSKCSRGRSVLAWAVAPRTQLRKGSWAHCGLIEISGGNKVCVLWSPTAMDGTGGVQSSVRCNVGGACFWATPPGSGPCSQQILAVSSISLWQNKCL